MARLLLESGAPDGYLLEDGTGVLLLDEEEAPPSGLLVLCGAECKITSGVAGTSHHWNAGSGTAPTIVAGLSANSDSAYNFVSVGAAAYLRRDVAAGVTTAAFRFRFKLNALPSGNAQILRFEISGASFQIRCSSSGSIGVFVNLVNEPILTASLDTTYLVEGYIDTSGAGGNVEMAARIDGGTLVVNDIASASGDITQVRIGNSGAVNIDIDFDDVLVTDTLADYPLGDGGIAGFPVGTTSGTHATPASLELSSGGDPSNGDSSGGLVDEIPASAADYIAQQTAGSAYWEGIYSTGGASADPLFVEQIVVVGSTSATANTQKAQLYDGASASDAYALASTGAGPTDFSGEWSEAPSGDPWTLALLQATRLRWGFSDDISPEPRLLATLLEVELPEPVAGDTEADAETIAVVGASAASLALIKPNAATIATSGLANAATIRISANAGLVAATGLANNVRSTQDARPTAATATGVALNVIPLLKPNAGLASGTGSALSPPTHIAPRAAIATATGLANNATVAIEADVNAAAELITISGTALNATARISANSALASGTGTALVAPARVSPNAAAATSTGTANNVGVSTTDQAPAETATATGAASNAASHVKPTAGISAATGAASNATVTTAVPQVLRPIADLSGNWHGEDARTTTLYTSVDDDPFSDSTYVESPADPDSSDFHEFDLPSASDPLVSTGHQVRYRYGGEGTATLVVELRQGTTVIASWSHVDPTTPTTVTQTLTGPEADSISDYTDLRIRVRGS